MLPTLLAALLAQACDPAAVSAVVGAIEAAEAPQWELTVGSSRCTWLSRGQRPTAGTLFDLASVTKPLTALALVKLEAEGKVSLADPVGKHLPAFRGRHTLALAHLLSHTSGFPAVVEVRDLERPDPDRVLARIATTRARFEPGTRAHYGDLNLVVAGRVIERVSGERLDHFLASALDPLEVDVTWTPGAAQVVPSGAPVRGQPHDPIARAASSAKHVTGNAGAFASLAALERLARRLTAPGPRTDWLEAARAQLAHPSSELGDVLGWTRWAAADGRPAFGKVGWTGTFVWIQPAADRFVVVLSNRTEGGAERAWADFDAVVAQVEALARTCPCLQPTRPGVHP